jgi:hypothetical protein
LELKLKIRNILAATAITAWSGMSYAGFVTTFGQTANGLASFPLTFYPEASNARNAFVTSLGPGASVSFYDFESAPLNATALNNISFGSVTANISGGMVDRPVSPLVTDEGRYSVSGVSGSSDQGSQYWKATAPNGSASSFTLDFVGGAVQSFGFFATDVGDWEGTLSLVLTRTDGSEETISPGSGGPFGNPIVGDDAEGSVLFFGVRATIAEDYFRSVRFISTGGSQEDVFSFDMFTVVAAPGGPVTPVSLPGTLGLVGVALAGVALLRRRA